MVSPLRNSKQFSTAPAKQPTKERTPKRLINVGEVQMHKKSLALLKPTPSFTLLRIRNGVDVDGT